MLASLYAASLVSCLRSRPAPVMRLCIALRTQVASSEATLEMVAPSPFGRVRRHTDAASLVSIGDNAFANTRITGTLVIPANVETIGDNAFTNTKLTGLDLSQAASLASIGDSAFRDTDITGTRS